MAKQGTTKYYSTKQEKYVAKLLGGQVVAGSGSPHFKAGDVVTNDWLFECKTTTKPKQSFAIKKEWIDKNERERMDSFKPYSALVFQFKEDGENFFVLHEKTFKQLLDKFQNE